MKKIIKIGAGLVGALPLLAFAQNAGYLTNLIKEAGKVVNALVIFLIALAVVWFIWNVISYTMSSDEDKKGKAKDQMINGIIAIAVMVSIWGLVALLRTTFGVNDSALPDSINNMIPPVI